jgi:hypothetical protein
LVIADRDTALNTAGYNVTNTPPTYNTLDNHIDDRLRSNLARADKFQAPQTDKSIWGHYLTNAIEECALQLLHFFPRPALRTYFFNKESEALCAGILGIAATYVSMKSLP